MYLLTLTPSPPSISQLEAARAEAVATQNKLRADLKNMQQSMNASYRLETSQALSLGTDPESTVRVNEAKAEAKVR